MVASGVILDDLLAVVRDPEPEEVDAHEDLTAHRADLPVLVAAMTASVDCFVTFNRRLFLDDAGVASTVGLRVSSPADALDWLRAAASAFL